MLVLLSLIVQFFLEQRVAMSPIDNIACHMEALSDTIVRQSLGAHPEQLSNSSLSAEYAN